MCQVEGKSSRGADVKAPDRERTCGLPRSNLLYAYAEGKKIGRIEARLTADCGLTLHLSELGVRNGRAYRCHTSTQNGKVEEASRGFLLFRGRCQNS